MSIILSGILLVNVLIFTLLCVSLFRVARVYSELRAFVSPVSDGQPSPLATAIDALAISFARAAVAQAKAHLMGAKGVDARQEAAVTGDIGLDLLGQNPMVAAALDRMPNLKRTLRRNPALIDLALRKLPDMLNKVSAAPMPAGVPMGTPPAPGGNHKPKFNL